MELHQRILQARKQKGLTQEQLSELSGLTVRSIQRIEAGATRPRAYTLKAIAQALDLDVDTLLARQESQQSPAKADIHPPLPDEEASRHFFPTALSLLLQLPGSALCPFFDSDFFTQKI